MDISFDQINDLLIKTMVGRFFGHHVNMAHLKKRMQEFWVLFLGYGPISHDLSQG
jgi:hypothetical protein